MKMQFNLVLNGNDTLEAKFQQAIVANPTLQMDLVRAFGQTIMLAFRLNESDQISIESFRAGRINEEPVQDIVKSEDKS